MEPAPQPNNPPGGPATAKKRWNPIRLVGLAIASSTPVSGFFSYAAVAILFGESRLEGAGGLTGLGLAVFGAPLIVGLVLVLGSFVTDRIPSIGALALTAGVASAALMGLGLWSIVTASGDASIGGGLLVAASLGLVLVSAALFSTDRPS